MYTLRVEVSLIFLDQSGKMKRLNWSRKIEGTSACSVIVYRHKPDFGVSCELWFILVILWLVRGKSSEYLFPQHTPAVYRCNNYSGFRIRRARVIKCNQFPRQKGGHGPRHSMRRRGLINHGGDGRDKLWWIQKKRLRICGGLVENQRHTQALFCIWRCLRPIYIYI